MGTTPRPHSYELYGSFDDIGAAKEAALAEINRGADMLFHNSDAAVSECFKPRRCSACMLAPIAIKTMLHRQ